MDSIIEVRVGREVCSLYVRPNKLKEREDGNGRMTGE